jgi:hypothetical protein
VTHLKGAVLRQGQPWGRAPGIVAGVATPPVSSDEIAVAPSCRSHRVTRQLRRPRTRTYGKKAVLRLAAGLSDELAVTTFLGKPTLPHWRSRCSGWAVTCATDEGL